MPQRRLPAESAAPPPPLPSTFISASAERGINMRKVLPCRSGGVSCTPLSSRSSRSFATMPSITSSSRNRNRTHSPSSFGRLRKHLPLGLKRLRELPHEIHRLHGTASVPTRAPRPASAGQSSPPAPGSPGSSSPCRWPDPAATPPPSCASRLELDLSRILGPFCGEILAKFPGVMLFLPLFLSTYWCLKG